MAEATSPVEFRERGRRPERKGETVVAVALRPKELAMRLVLIERHQSPNTYRKGCVPQSGPLYWS